MIWNHPESLVVKIFNTTSTNKVMMIVSWGRKRLLLVDFIHKWEPINADCSIELSGSYGKSFIENVFDTDPK